MGAAGCSASATLIWAPKATLARATTFGGLESWAPDCYDYLKATPLPPAPLLAMCLECCIVWHCGVNIGPRSVSRAIMKQRAIMKRIQKYQWFWALQRVGNVSEIYKKSVRKRSEVKIPKPHPKMSEKVANMAPRWAQDGAMLGTKTASRRPKTNEVAGWKRVRVGVGRGEGGHGRVN